MITIKFDDKEVKEALEKLSKKLSDLSPVMREIAGIMHDAIKQNFAQERNTYKGMRFLYSLLAKSEFLKNLV